MIPNVPYIVTKGNATFRKGDKIQLDPEGYITRKGFGWIEPTDVPAALKRLNYEVDHEELQRRRARLVHQLKELDQLEVLVNLNTPTP